MGLSRSRVKLGCVALVMLVAGVGTGCGSSSTSSSDGEAKAPTTTKAPPRQAEFDGALLTFNDLPGWAPMTDADPDDDRWCPDASAALTEILSGGGNRTGFVAFWKGMFGPFVSEQVTVVDDGEASFVAAQQALDSCTSRSWTETHCANDMTIKHSLKPGVVPADGYHQAAYKLTWSSNNYTAEGYVVLIRIDGALMSSTVRSFPTRLIRSTSSSSPQSLTPPLGSSPCCSTTSTAGADPDARASMLGACGTVRADRGVVEIAADDRPSPGPVVYHEEALSSVLARSVSGHRRSLSSAPRDRDHRPFRRSAEAPRFLIRGSTA